MGIFRFVGCLFIAIVALGFLGFQAICISSNDKYVSVAHAACTSIEVANKDDKVQVLKVVCGDIIKEFEFTENFRLTKRDIPVLMMAMGKPIECHKEIGKFSNNERVMCYEQGKR